jgi:hypothetical protein
MRRPVTTWGIARSVLACIVLLVIARPAIASAEPTASIKHFRVQAVPISKPGGGTWLNTGNCLGCGAALELEYEIEGSGYGATPHMPQGGIPPISQVNLYFPAETKLHPVGFGSCTEATLKNIGPSGCPVSSIASPIGNMLGEVTFGEERVPEESELSAFFGEGGLLFYTVGHSPVSLEIVGRGQYVTSGPPYGEELRWLWPPVASVPGAPLASTKFLKGTVGAATGIGTTPISYFTLPTTCTGGLPFKTEVQFGGTGAGAHEFGIPLKTVVATYEAPCPVLLQPVLGQAQAVAVVAGIVTVRLKGTSTFVPLNGATKIPDGSEVDTTNGRVLLTAAAPTGTATVEPYGGRFVVHQDRGGTDETHLALSLPLTGCSRVPLPHGSPASAAMYLRHGSKSRHLWASEHGGSWGTTGRYVSTSVEGTTWLTTDECNRSTVQVTAGVVKVRDLLTNRTRVVTAGKRYVARRR